MLAERVRDGVCSHPVADGQQVTMSLGVTASGDGRVFDYDELFGEADAALYRAKASGRNRVCTAGEAAPAPRAPAIA